MSPPLSIGNFVYKRILGLEPKRRKQTRVQIEEELLTTVQMQCLDLNDLVNLSLHQYLQEKNIRN